MNGPEKVNGPETPDAPRNDVASVLRAGWRTALVRALIALAIPLVLSELLSVLSSAAQPFPFPLPTGEPPAEGFELSPGQVAANGVIGFLQYHRVTVEIDLPPIPDLPIPGEFDVAFAWAPMLGTGLIAWLLFLAGRATARRAGGPGWARAVHGLKPAIPYAIATLLLGIFVRQSVAFPEVPGSPFPPGLGITVGATPVSAFLWPLAIGLVFGAAGGIASARDQVFVGTWGARAGAVVAGAWRMAWVALALAFVGLLVLAAVHPDGTATYFRLLGELGPAGGAGFLLTTVLFLPNMSAWVASGAAGGTTLSLSFFGSSCPLISYWSFPAGAADGGEPQAFDPCALLEGGINFDVAPLGYFLYLLVPLAAAFLGGRRASQRLGATSRGAGAAAGAVAGILFALLFLALLFLSGLGARFTGALAAFTGGGFAVGPGLFLGFGVGLAWGVLMGSLGGALAARPPAAPAVRSEPAPEGAPTQPLG